MGLLDDREFYDFWVEQFFLADGWPKYFPDRLYPADIHSTASAIVALVELRGTIPGALPLARKIAAIILAVWRSGTPYCEAMVISKSKYRDEHPS